MPACFATVNGSRIVSTYTYVMKRSVVVPAAIAVIAVSGSGWSTLAVKGSPCAGCDGANTCGTATWSGSARPVNPMRSAARATSTYCRTSGSKMRGSQYSTAERLLDATQPW